MKIITALLSPLILMACSSQSTPNTQSLTGSEWGTDVADQFIQFMANGTVSGNGGCNRFGASYTQEGTALSIGPVRSTKMACANLSEEQKFFDTLRQTTSIEASHLKLIFKGGDGTALLTLQRRDWD